MNSCHFCNMPKNRILIENSSAFFVKDLYPVSDGHSLIIPKRHIESFFEATEFEQIQMLELLSQGHKLLQQECSPQSYNIGINDGKEAGQTVSHLHIHLIPRYSQDIKDPRGGVRWVLPNKAKYWD
jgi:diadenosine tetraphosphate (Ap4A) HIT family hydrolase